MPGAETLAEEYERLAQEAGEQHARISGGPPHPNTHLQFLANTMRKIGKPVTLTTIKGVKAEDETGPA